MSVTVLDIKNTYCRNMKKLSNQYFLSKFGSIPSDLFVVRKDYLIHLFDFFKIQWRDFYWGLEIVLIQLWFSIPGVWSSKATASKSYSPGKYFGGAVFSPEGGRKSFPGVTKRAEGNDRNACSETEWGIQKTNGTFSSELESSRSSEESSKFFRYRGGRGEERYSKLLSLILTLF